ncbi:uncharacterized protein HMPREF1120_08483 [Exophiala dermatitidis NIH/UT8656]|uniref:Uncharacterized protein n=1 Tax=Exophiala dermatitidis (strain ATCC 34100 / CBS 525.76 / NIH/UT8656) TaxID=858893 RepID=H6C8V0_EXODN|nr:uncharacterized protein HMPREF1120_08483 [Exophiala dermatitidis NIH/UT8656]EHY60527.1 hypothetical protein HMPREF1120_08483 [Exophiala dermatitidis NIH/UT8656]KAJ4581691.1 hypothetical protein HRR79_009813 [Exophiala dermatitidis]
MRIQLDVPIQTAGELQRPTSRRRTAELLPAVEGLPLVSIILFASDFPACLNIWGSSMHIGKRFAQFATVVEASVLCTVTHHQGGGLSRLHQQFLFRSWNNAVSHHRRETDEAD